MHIHIHTTHGTPKTYIAIHAPHAPTNTHVHHQTSPKHKIYIVGLPSVLYETPGLNERSVLNQLFLLLFSVAFHKKRNTFHIKSTAFREKRNAFHCELLGYHQV